MSSLLTWRINGLDLDDFASFGLIVEPSMWRAPVSTRLVSIEIIPGRHGVLSPGLPVFEAPLITLSVWRAGTQAQIEEATNALVAVLTQPTVTVTRESAGLVTSAPAKLVSIGFENFLVDTTSRATAVLRIPSVFFRGAIETTAEVRRNYCTAPRATAAWGAFAGTGGAVTTTTPADARWKGGTARRAVWTTAGTGLGYVSSAAAGAMAVGETWLIAMRVAVVGYSGVLGLSVGGTNAPTVTSGALNTIDHGDGTVTLWRTVTCTSLGAGTGAFVFFVYITNGQVGHELWVGDAIAEKGATSFAGYFDGGYSPVLGLIPAWTGTVNASESTLSTGSETSYAFTSDLTNVAIHHLAGSTAPITDPIIRITGPCTNPTITDPTTGTGISWTGTVAASTYLYLHPDRLTARTSASDTAWLSGGTNVSSGIDYPAPGPLQLWPMVDSFTSRTIRLSATGTGKTAATRLTVRAARSFL